MCDTQSARFASWLCLETGPLQKPSDFGTETPSHEGPKFKTQNNMDVRNTDHMGTAFPDNHRDRILNNENVYSTSPPETHSAEILNKVLT